MSLHNIAKQLLNEAAPIPSGKSERLNAARALERNGLGVDTVLTEYRNLLDDCGEDDKSVKLKALGDLAKMSGLMQIEEQQRAAPIIHLNINGDNARVNAMLCPNFNEAA